MRAHKPTTDCMYVSWTVGDRQILSEIQFVQKPANGIRIDYSELGYRVLKCSAQECHSLFRYTIPYNTFAIMLFYIRICRLPETIVVNLVGMLSLFCFYFLSHFRFVAHSNLASASHALIRKEEENKTRKGCTDSLCTSSRSPKLK